MLVEMGTADAFGAGFEYALRHIGPKVYHKRNDLSRYWPHPKWGQPGDGSYIPTEPGRYTDDTQMGLAVAEFMLSKQMDSPTALTLADQFVLAFKRDPRPGYAGHFYEVLKQFNDGADFLATISPLSRKSGGAMRAGPAGLISDTEACIDFAMFQASLTHATMDGMASAAVSALMVHYGYYRLGPKADLPVFLNKWVPGYQWHRPHQGAVGYSGIEAVAAALTALMQHDNQALILRRSVAFTGDVDTVAAIALCAASVYDEVGQNLPQVLLDGLEDGPYGKAYLEGIDLALQAKYPRDKGVKPKGTDDDADLFTLLKQ